MGRTIMTSKQLLEYWRDRIKYYEDEEYLTEEKILQLIEQLLKMND